MAILGYTSVDDLFMQTSVFFRMGLVWACGIANVCTFLFEESLYEMVVQVVTAGVAGGALVCWSHKHSIPLEHYIDPHIMSTTTHN